MKDVRKDTQTYENLRNFDDQYNSYLSNTIEELDLIVVDQLEKIGFSKEEIKQSVMGKKFDHLYSCY